MQLQSSRLRSENRLNIHSAEWSARVLIRQRYFSLVPVKHCSLLMDEIPLPVRMPHLERPQRAIPRSGVYSGERSRRTLPRSFGTRTQPTCIVKSMKPFRPNPQPPRNESCTFLQLVNSQGRSSTYFIS